MRFFQAMLAIAAAAALSQCTSEGVNYSRALFEHIPGDPEVLVLVKPNDVTQLAEVAIEELKLQEMFGDRLDLNGDLLERYKKISGEMLEAVGIPWSQVESIGFLLYFQQPVVLVSGAFAQETVTTKLAELGFKQEDTGYFEYIYANQKLAVPADGLMMMAREDLLEDLSFVPVEERLWNRADFKEYRTKSPLSNSLFVWSHPPDNLLSDFKYRDDIGNVSLAVDFSGNLTMKATLRMEDPQKVVFLHDIVLGTVTVGAGFFGDDPDYGPVLKGIKVTQNAREVEATLVVPQQRVKALKDRVVDDFNNPDSQTFNRLTSFLEGFQ